LFGQLVARTGPTALGFFHSVKVTSTNILSKPGATNDLTHASVIGFKRGIIEF
jgi:hypothetical protein